MVRVEVPAHCDRVLALQLGANDFIAKPVETYELEARIRATLRRASGDRSDVQPQQLRVGSLVVDRSRHSVAVGGQELWTTPAEHRLLWALASSPNRPFSREVLAQAVWGHEVANIGRVIDVHMSRLKRKLLRAAAAKAPRIVSVRGEGYKLELNHDNDASTT